MSLGQVAAREQLFGRVLGPDLPTEQIEAIAWHIRAAAAALNEAESLFQPPFAGNRPAGALRQIRNGLEGYVAWRASRTPQHRREELENLAQRYRRTLSYTFSSARQDALQGKPNCDSTHATMVRMVHRLTGSRIGGGQGR